MNLTRDELTQLLREAAEAHHKYEESAGRDSDWPAWYAKWIEAKKTGTSDCGDHYTEQTVVRDIGHPGRVAVFKK